MEPWLLFHPFWEDVKGTVAAREALHTQEFVLLRYNACPSQKTSEIEDTKDQDQLINAICELYFLLNQFLFFLNQSATFLGFDVSFF